MPFSDRLHYVAIRGCLLACILVAGPTLAQYEDRHDYVDTSEAAENKEAAQPLATTYFTPGFKVDQHTYSAICDQPKNKEHADLCQQWRMAEAAEFQIWLSAIGVLLLIGTLIFTAIAARAARDAAKSAREAADAANSSAQSDREANILTQVHAGQQLRAYLHIDDTKGPDLDSGPPFIFEFFIKNGGQTPAYTVKQWTGYTLGPHPLYQELPPPKAAPRYSAIIGAEGRVKVMAEIDQYTPDEVMKIKGDAVRLYVFGVITYRDIFDTDWDTPFRMMYGGPEARHSRGMLFCEQGNDPKQNGKRST